MKNTKVIAAFPACGKTYYFNNHKDGTTVLDSDSSQFSWTYEIMKDKDWKERVFQVDKGWEKAFQHFAKAFLDQTEPLNANGKAGKLANDIAYALLESKKSGMPVEL